jgi:hypothetical protein
MPLGLDSLARKATLAYASGAWLQREREGGRRVLQSCPQQARLAYAQEISPIGASSAGRVA